jgi:hypothetical protein
MRLIFIKLVPVFPFIVLALAALVAAYHVHRYW